MGPPIFNLVNVPWALVLLLLVGIGPLIAWRKATRRNLRRNFLGTGLVGLWVLLAMALWDGPWVYLEALRGFGRTAASLDVAGFFEQAQTFYPALTVGIGAFVFATVALEFYRGARVRVRQHGEAVPVAVGRLVWRNKRRFGGYIVHVGVVVIFIGIAGSSAYRQETVRLLSPGEYLGIDDYLVRYEGYRLEAVDDHVGAITELRVFDARTGEDLGRLAPEQRIHPNMLFPPLREAFLRAKALHAANDPGAAAAVADVYGLIPALERQAQREVKVPSTEVGIRAFVTPFTGLRRMGEDLYAIPLFVDPSTGQANFRVFVNPMVNFIWFGGLIFVIGAHLAVLPDRRERRRLESALALEERAVA
jgi:cytochrome c-type biogenesis protein CcmF